MPNFSFNTAFASALLSAAALASDESLSKEKNPFVPYKLRGVHSSTNVDDVGGTPSVPLVLEEIEEDIPQVKDLEKGAPHGETLRNVIPDSNISNKVSFVFDPLAELGRLENSLVADHASADRTGEEVSIFIDDEGYPFYSQWVGGYLQYNYYDTSKWTTSELEQYKESTKMEVHHSPEALEVHRELGDDHESGARELGKEGAITNGCGGYYPVITADSASSFINVINDCLSNNVCPEDGDIGCWDVSYITDMRAAFDSKEDFNEDISMWDTAKVTTMRGMFYYAKTFDQDISYWNTTSVSDMNRMFDHAYIFNQPIGRWDVSSVTDMGVMFGKASSFNQPLEYWDVAKVTLMNLAMAYTSFNQCLSSWASKVPDNVYLKGMFDQSYCTVGETPQVDVSPWCQTVSNGCPTFIPPTEAPTPGPTPSPTPGSTPLPTPGPTASPTPGPTPSPTPGPTASPTASPTPGPTPSPTPGPTPSPTPGPTASPTPGPTPSPTPGPTPSPTPGPTPSPTASPTPGPTPSPTPGPTSSPTPGQTPSPTASPTPGPTPSPTPGPTPSPTPGPTDSPTENPTKSPTENPTDSPTKNPTLFCTDNDLKIFEIDLNGEIKTDGDCNWLASKNASKRKKYCGMRVKVRPNPSKKLSAICKETCGLVGLGQCAADCEDKSKKFEIVVDGEGTKKRKDCDWVASKKKSIRREFCNMEVEINGKMKILPKICTKTCGEFGKGKCTFNLLLL